MLQECEDLCTLCLQTDDNFAKEQLLVQRRAVQEALLLEQELVEGAPHAGR